ncbi:MAG: c-type cytochrome [Epsilonproteobacteria bacterium]|nr:c-type cytochrome [Campylobacterota bacterium]
MKKLAIVALVAAGTISLMAADGKALAAKCAGCHGADFSKKALGVSKVVKGWSAEKIAKALEGYKAGTYGGSMKGVMKGQVASYSDADIKAVSEYIAGIK